MSGHSKWHNIQAKKGKADAKRGKMFTKLGKEITVITKSGGPNPESNPRLRDAISKAKSNNMPLDTINRIIKKASGDDNSVNYEELTYEGYGPAGVAIIIEVLTDNKNRAAGDIRHSLERSGGNLGANGCVSWMFEKKGIIIVEKKDSIDEDELMMMALDAGAEDFSPEDDVYEITTSPEEFSHVREELEGKGIEFASAEVSMIPNNTVSLNRESAGKVERVVDELEDNDDVQNVYHNAEFPEGWGEEE
jgi:YebC/PmpR family DNA-binding regulatory protein